MKRGNVKIRIFSGTLELEEIRNDDERDIAFYILPYYFHIIRDILGQTILRKAVFVVAPHMSGVLQRAEELSRYKTNPGSSYNGLLID